MVSLLFYYSFLADHSEVPCTDGPGCGKILKYSKQWLLDDTDVVSYYYKIIIIKYQ